MENRVKYAGIEAFIIVDPVDPVDPKNEAQRGWLLFEFMVIMTNPTT